MIASTTTLYKEFHECNNLTIGYIGEGNIKGKNMKVYGLVGHLKEVDNNGQEWTAFTRFKNNKGFWKNIKLRNFISQAYAEDNIKEYLSRNFLEVEEVLLGYFPTNHQS